MNSSRFWSVEITLDKYDNDSDFQDFNYKREAISYAKSLLRKYGKRIVKLDVKLFTDEEGLTEHIQLI